MAKTSHSVPGNPYHSTGGNFPSKTGNVSGNGRGNNPAGTSKGSGRSTSSGGKKSR